MGQIYNIPFLTIQGIYSKVVLIFSTIKVSTILQKTVLFDATMRIVLWGVITAKYMLNEDTKSLAFVTITVLVLRTIYLKHWGRQFLNKLSIWKYMDSGESSKTTVHMVCL